MDWISITDRLPTLDTDVLVVAHGNDSKMGPYVEVEISSLREYHGKENGVDWECTLCCQEAVTHWMPLPDPPHPL